MLGPDAAEDHDELVTIGWATTDSPAVLAYVDPIEDEARRPRAESPRGLPLYRHPLASVRDEPALWSITDRFLAGVQRELTHEHYDTWSAWEVDAWSTMVAAAQRQDMREMKQERGDG